MHVLLILLGLLGGFATPVSLAAITPLQWVSVGLAVAGKAQKLPGDLARFQALVESPAFRAWVAANGEAAIKLQPGEVTER